MKELQGAILSQNHKRSQGVAQGGTGPQVEMPPMTKIWQKNLFLRFQFLLAFLRTTVQTDNSN